jgi:hypothetical protein
MIPNQENKETARSINCLLRRHEAFLRHPEKLHFNNRDVVPIDPPRPRSSGCSVLRARVYYLVGQVIGIYLPR